MAKTREELSALLAQKKKFTYPSDVSTEDRIVGAIMGTLIGDALGVGCHWIYDFEELWRDYGPWIDDYQDPKAVNEGGSFEMISAYRHSAGVRAGMNSQTGQLLQKLLETEAANCQANPQGSFIQEEYIDSINDFFENTILPKATFETDIDIYNAHKGVTLEHGTFIGSANGIKCFSGRYTNEEVRFNFDFWYNNGKKDGRWWYPNSNVTMTSTTDIGQTAVVLAGLYRNPRDLFYKAYEMLSMWYTDKAFITSQLLHIMTVQGLINNVPLNDFDNYLVALFQNIDAVGKYIPSFDDILMFNDVKQLAARDNLFQIQDDRFASLLFGMNCHSFNLIPCSYYYAIKYANDFEKGILTAVNSGGNNMARAALTGGLIGAMVGIKGIPQRFIDGLITDEPLPKGYTSHGQYLLDLAKIIAAKTNGKIPSMELAHQSDCGCYVDLD